MTLPIPLLALLLGALLLPGCSMLTSSGRQQAAYARYVNKQSHGRVKQQRMFHSSGKPQMPMNDEPAEASEETASSGPQSDAENVP